MALGVADGKMARRADKPEDRHTFTVDVGQIMAFLAEADDLEPYLALREFAVANLVVNNPDTPFTQGFVLWRHNPSQPPDASGTTEALRLVRALWTGAERFKRPQDADLALLILDGYLRHERTEQGVWFIANYYKFDTNHFATNSFIVDYDPDLVRRVADDLRETDTYRHQKYSELADHSYGVVRRAVAPSGLLYDVLQPEMKTMYYEKDVSCFSPNDVIQVNNSCATAATVARGDPAIGQGVLGFLLPRVGELRLQYFGRTGEVAFNMRVSAPSTPPWPASPACSASRPPPPRSSSGGWRTGARRQQPRARRRVDGQRSAAGPPGRPRLTGRHPSPPVSPPPARRDAHPRFSCEP